MSFRVSIRDLSHVCHESIAAFWDCLNVEVLVAIIAQRFPQSEDVHRKVALLDKAIGPDSLHQIVFLNCFAAGLYEREKDVEDFGGKRNNLALSEEYPFGRVKTEGSEFVEVLCFPVKTSHKTSLRNIKRFLRTSKPASGIVRAASKGRLRVDVRAKESALEGRKPLGPGYLTAGSQA